MRVYIIYICTYSNKLLSPPHSHTFFTIDTMIIFRSLPPMKVACKDSAFNRVGLAYPLTEF